MAPEKKTVELILRVRVPAEMTITQVKQEVRSLVDSQCNLAAYVKDLTVERVVKSPFAVYSWLSMQATWGVRHIMMKNGVPLGVEVEQYADKTSGVKLFEAFESARACIPFQELRDAKTAAVARDIARSQQ